MVLYILLGLGVFALIFIAFMLMAIWRAILGKSTVDLRLHAGIDVLSKRIDKVNSQFQGYSTSQGTLTIEMREMKREAHNLVQVLKKSNEKKDEAGH